MKTSILREGINNMRIFSRFLFYLSSITGALLLFAILLDVFMFKEEVMFELNEYLQCFALIFLAVAIKYTMIPYYDKKREG
ncbi:hypothetical protein KDJ21_007650 [Metabacillus litoralis]|uniref:hypothetical protein n=1 Tax=Metabacillus litoralis TaxID=152268 RepID=UPI001B8E36FB|nr:hypothetical protein [Metabacillus litoralis]UHA61519.1 hypothetical protein KDJ21_007650 [Metabacillus litoralis]